MSVLTTRVLKCVPSAAAGITVTAGGSAWANGSWVELIASAAADLAITGLVVLPASSQFEIEIGVGAASSEVPIGVVAWYAGNTAAGAPGHLSLPIAIGGIAAGSRVALRARSATGSTDHLCKAQYLENPDTDQVTTQPLAAAPAAAAQVTITPDSTGWNNTGFVEITSGLADPAGIAGFAIRHGIVHVDYELDVATGGAGSEQVITTIRSASVTAGGNVRSHAMLPFVHLINATTRVSVRLRKSGTDTTDWSVKLLYYGALSLVSERTTAVWY